MTDYISREKALEIRVSCGYNDDGILFIPLRDVREHLRSIPAADVAPVVHATWKINADGYYPYCSACNKEPPGRCMTAHCPSCGARMDMDKEEKNELPITD